MLHKSTRHSVRSWGKFKATARSAPETGRLSLGLPKQAPQSPPTLGFLSAWARTQTPGSSTRRRPDGQFSLNQSQGL